MYSALIAALTAINLQPYFSLKFMTFSSVVVVALCEYIHCFFTCQGVLLLS